MNLTISQNIFNSNYRNTVKKENQKKSNQTSVISKNQSFQICSKQASQALKNNISFGRPQIPTINRVAIIDRIEEVHNNLIRNGAQIIPATAKIQNKYKQELLKNLKVFKANGYDEMSIADNVLNNPEFLRLNNFAKDTNVSNSFQIYVYPKDDNHSVKGVKIGGNGQRIRNVGLVCFDFIKDDEIDILNSYSIKSRKNHYLSNLKVKLEDEDPEREYEVHKATDLYYVDYFIEDLDENCEGDPINHLMATNESHNDYDGELGTVNINGLEIQVLEIDNDLNGSFAL